MPRRQSFTVCGIKKKIVVWTFTNEKKKLLKNPD